MEVFSWGKLASAQMGQIPSIAALEKTVLLQNLLAIALRDPPKYQEQKKINTNSIGRGELTERQKKNNENKMRTAGAG